MRVQNTSGKGKKQDVILPFFFTGKYYKMTELRLGWSWLNAAIKIRASMMHGTIFFSLSCYYWQALYYVSGCDCIIFSWLLKVLDRYKSVFSIYCLFFRYVTTTWFIFPLTIYAKVINLLRNKDFDFYNEKFLFNFIYLLVLKKKIFFNNNI